MLIVTQLVLSMAVQSNQTIIPQPREYTFLEVGAKAMTSNNISRTSSNPERGEKRTVFISTLYEKALRRVALKLDYDLAHSQYKDDRFADETFLTGSGNVNFTVVPSTYHIILGHSRYKLLSDPAKGRTPTNFSEQESFTLGQKIETAPATKHQVTLENNLFKHDLEKNRFQSSQGHNHIFNWHYLLRPSFFIGLGASYAEIELASDINYDYTTPFMSMRWQRPNSQLMMQLGQSRLSSDTLSQTVDGESLSIVWSHMSESLNYAISASRQIKDSSRSQSFGELTNEEQALEVRSVRIFWRDEAVMRFEVPFFNNQLFTQFSLLYGKETPIETSNLIYQNGKPTGLELGGGDTGYKPNYYGAIIEAYYRFSGRLVSRLRVRSTRFEYQNGNEVDRQQGKLSLEYNFYEGWIGELELRLEKSDDPSLIQEYDEQTIALSLRYRWK